MEQYVHICLAFKIALLFIAFMVFESETVKDFLNCELDRRVKVNSRYSMRSFAKQLKLSPGELSELLRGKRHLSLKSALKISNSLSLNEMESKYLMYLMQREKSKSLGIESSLTMEWKEFAKVQVAQDHFTKISEWYHFAILNLLDVKDFIWNSRWVAKKLSLSPTQAQMAMRNLQEVGLVVKENERWVRSQTTLETGGMGANEAIRKYHSQMLHKALESLEIDSFNEREVSGVGFVCDKGQIPSLKKEISEFLDKIIAKYHQEGASDIFQIELACFRLTNREK